MVSITRRRRSGGCIPSWSARFQAPAYHAHVTPLALSVSPMVFCVCGARVWRVGSVPRGSPSGAGGTRDGCQGGCVVLTENPSGVTAPSRSSGGPSSTEAGDPGRVLSQPRSSSWARRAILGRARADQPEVIQVGAAKGAHEEVVGEDVVLRPLPQRQGGTVVV